MISLRLYNLTFEIYLIWDLGFVRIVWVSTNVKNITRGAFIGLFCLYESCHTKLVSGLDLSGDNVGKEWLSSSASWVHRLYKYHTIGLFNEKGRTQVSNNYVILLFYNWKASLPISRLMKGCF